MKGLGGGAQICDGVAEKHRCAVNFHNLVCRLVALLLTHRRPAAIAGLVVAAWVDPVKRLLRGRFAHVGKEILKRLPPIAHPNTFVEVVRARRCVRFIATAQAHVLPYAVDARAAFAVRGDGIKKRAAATDLCAGLKLIGGGRGF